MRVIATQLGVYDGKLRFIDEEFELKEVHGLVQDMRSGKTSPIKYSVESQFSEKWMMKLDECETAVAAPKKKSRSFNSKSENNNSEIV